MKSSIKPATRASAEEYHRKYEKFKQQGHSFWPNIILEDIIAALVVLAAIISLIVVVGIPLGNVADPANRSFLPRPEWYFMFLFEFLKYFPGSLEWLGVMLPGIAVVWLLLWPFLDRSPQHSPHRQPIAPGLVAISLGVIAYLTFLAYQGVPSEPEKEMALSLTGLQQKGRSLFLDQGCLSCHQLNGRGQGIPLDKIGDRMDAEQIHNYIAFPKQANPNAAMPSFGGTLSHRDMEAIANYLAIFQSNRGVTP